jgi:Flp pilus assembly protein TadG
MLAKTPAKKSILSRFRSDRKGNFAIATAVIFPCMFAAVGLAVDSVNLLRLRAELQNANDAGALFAARFYQVNQRAPNDAQVFEFVQANYKVGPVDKVTFTLDKASSTIKVDSDATVKPFIMGFFDQGATSVAVVSAATIGVNGALEFSLALDTTASMQEANRIGGLKTAASNFVNVLYDMKDRGADIQGAIVPFARYVNVGVSRRKAPWLDVPKDIDTRKTTTVTEVVTPVIGETNCRIENIAEFTRVIPAKPEQCWTNDGVSFCNPAEPERTEFVPARQERVCDPIYGPEETVKRKVTTGQLITWNGCVSSRAEPDNLAEEFGGKRFPGVLGKKCAEELLPLTGSRSVLLKKINSLKPYDETYIPEGVMWGIRTLTNGEPFTEAKLPDAGGKTLRKALVVMTDGQNTLSAIPDNKSMSANNIVHNGTDAAEANRLTSAACAVAKAGGLEVYTISFGPRVPGPVRTLLESCATEPKYYFHASDAASLNSAFQNIADNLLSVRLTQ